jgi:hypothetical protein
MLQASLITQNVASFAYNRKLNAEQAGLEPFESILTTPIASQSRLDETNEAV